MRSAAAWSVKATPLASMAQAAVFALGVFSLIYAAVLLALQGAAWNFPAFLCLFLGAVLVLMRLRAARPRVARTLSWNPDKQCFQLSGVDDDLALSRVYYGAGWVTLGLRPQGSRGRTLQLVLWKSAMPAPMWNELALRVQAGVGRSIGH